MYDWKKEFTEDEIRDWIRFGSDSREDTARRLVYISAITPGQEYKVKTNGLRRKLLDCFPDEETYLSAYYQIRSEKKQKKETYRRQADLSSEKAEERTYIPLRAEYIFDDTNSGNFFGFF